MLELALTLVLTENQRASNWSHPSVPYLYLSLCKAVPCTRQFSLPPGAVDGGYRHLVEGFKEGLFSCSSEEVWGRAADEELGEEAEPNICFSAKQSSSLQVTLNMHHQQHAWKIRSAGRIIKPTHLTGVGEASLAQRFVTVTAQRTCNKRLRFVYEELSWDQNLQGPIQEQLKGPCLPLGISNPRQQGS